MKINGTPYTDFHYIQNPRTEVKHIFRPDDPLARIVLEKYEQKGWWAQLKLNGTRSGVYVTPEKDVFGWNRDGEPHRAWQFTDATAAIFRGHRGRKWAWFDGELMHNKTPHIKDTHYLYDILVKDNLHLVRTTYAERYKILEKLWTKQEEKLGYWILDEYTWLARNYKSGFLKLYKEISDIPEVEGLVLKNPKGIYFTPDAGSWMVKARRK